MRHRRSVESALQLQLMAKMLMQNGKPAEALPHIQDAVTIFEGTGSRHLPEAEATLEERQVESDSSEFFLTGSTSVSKMEESAFVINIGLKPEGVLRAFRFGITGGE